MKRLSLKLSVIGLVLGGCLLVAGCGDASEKSAPNRTFDETEFRAANFVDPRRGANRWLPLKPGTQWVRKGTTLIGNREVPHEVITTVTDVVREIQGVKTVLMYDHSVGAGQVVQESLDYFAQDRNGAVWTMGGATEQYEAGRFVAVDEAWLSGVDGGKAGILMPANPTAETPAWAIAQPPGEDGDAAEFLRMQKQECEPFGCFKDVLVIREGKRSALDNEFKYYADGVGQIRNEPRGASRHEDIERLVNVTMLSPEGLAEAGREALRIDRQAAKEMPELFGKVKATRAR
ncbi:MAG: hypothetical protein ABIO51_06745 [Solirubrobacteraceae bacterium]